MSRPELQKKRPWLIASLWILVMVSSLAVIYTTHTVRQRYNELETLNDEAYQLDVEWGQLLLEQSTWSAYDRTERIAQQRLGMKHPENADIELVAP